MNDESYLKLKLQEGEGFKVEFKEKLADLDREIVAFANATGGEIYIGVNDKGEIKGIEITNALLSQIQDIARNCDPSIQISFKKYNQHGILIVFVDEGNNKPYKCKDGFFLRVGPNSQKLRRDEIIQFINDVGKIHFDEAINRRFKYPADFSKKAFDDYLKHCGIDLKASSEDILLSLNLAHKDKSLFQVTNTGVLFFAKNLQSFFPEAYITAVRYQSNDRFSIIDKKDFMGSLLSQIEESLAFVIRHMNVAADFSDSAKGVRQDIYDYPPVALREAIINAITHRDYLYDGAHIYIHMYPEFIEIENPGGLYRGLTIDDLGRRSVRRNRLIADLLHRARFIERVGSGFDRMRRALAENKNPALEVKASTFFNIRFFKRSQDFNLQNLSARQLKIYHHLLERKVITKKDIALLLKLSDDTALREIRTLIQLNLIKKHGEGKTTTYVLNPQTRSSG
ncbi:MAG: RNA-binding domain-containing protein [Candidatus Berkiellales bacterium]